MPGVVDGADGRGHSGQQRLRLDRSRRPDPAAGERRRNPLPRPAGVRRDRRNARRGAPRRRQGQGRADHRGAAPGDHAAGRACARPVRGAADAPCAARHANEGDEAPCAPPSPGAAPPEAHARRGRAGAVLPRRPDQLRHSEGRRRAAHALLDPAPERDAAPGGACAAPAVERGACRMPAHGRRLRRQGIAVGPVRLRGRHRGAASSAPCEAAAGPRRRLHDHRPAPLLLVRVRSGLRRRRPHARRRDHDGLARRPLGRPVGPGDDPRAVPLRQRLLAARRVHARLLGQDQHAEQHRLPRLRRPAGRHCHREHPRLGGARTGSATRWTCGASTSTARPSATSRRTARW
jgi:hypothetical protein